MQARARRPENGSPSTKEGEDKPAIVYCKRQAAGFPAARLFSHQQNFQIEFFLSYHIAITSLAVLIRVFPERLVFLTLISPPLLLPLAFDNRFRSDP